MPLQKSESPAATGQCANSKDFSHDFTPAEKLSNPADAEKEFATLRAQFAMRGHTLHRSHPADGPVTFCAERWGLSRYLPTLDDARRFLVQIGGGV